MLAVFFQMLSLAFFYYWWEHLKLFRKYKRGVDEMSNKQFYIFLSLNFGILCLVSIGCFCCFEGMWLWDFMERVPVILLIFPLLISYLIYRQYEKIKQENNDIITKTEKIELEIKEESNNDVHEEASNRLFETEIETDCIGKIYNNPIILNKCSTTLKVISINVQKNQTIITLSENNKASKDESYERMSLDKASFIIANGQKFSLIKAEGIAISPDKTYFSHVNETKTFSLFFPAIPDNTTSIDFIENDESEWKIYGIQL